MCQHGSYSEKCAGRGLSLLTRQLCCFNAVVTRTQETQPCVGTTSVVIQDVPQLPRLIQYIPCISGMLSESVTTLACPQYLSVQLLECHFDCKNRFVMVVSARSIHIRDGGQIVRNVIHQFCRTIIIII